MNENKIRLNIEKLRLISLKGSISIDMWNYYFNEYLNARNICNYNSNVLLSFNELLLRCSINTEIFDKNNHKMCLTVLQNDLSHILYDETLYFEDEHHISMR